MKAARHKRGSFPLPEPVCMLVYVLTVLVWPQAVHAQPSDTPNPSVYVTNGPVYAIARYNNTLYIGGSFTMAGPNGGAINIPRNSIAAIDATTGQVTAWDPSANGTVLALAVSSDGNTVYAAGEFTTIGLQTRNRIVALDAVTGLATAWDPNASSPVEALSVSGSTVYAGGVFTNIGGKARDRIAAIDDATGVATDWNPGASSTVKALAIAGSSVYVGGSFTTIDGQSRNRIASIDIASGAVTNWNPNANGTVETLAISSDSNTVYAGGWFTSIGGQSRNYLAALDANSGSATAWNPSANLFVNTTAVSPDDSTVYAGGFFTSIGGQSRNYIAALDAATGQASAWDPDASSFTEALVVTSSNVYAGGFFTAMGGSSQGYFAYFGDLANAVPNAPSNLGPANYVNGSSGTEKSPQLQFTQTDPNAGDTLAYRIQIDNDSNFASPIVDFTSGSLPQGATSYTVGQQLAAGSYYWRVRSNDGTLDGNWATANNGAVAFVITEPSVDFSSDTYNGSEGDGAITITVNLSFDSDETITVNYASSDGTAASSSDYTGVSGTLTFNPGQSSKSFIITPIDDDIDENDETVVLTLSSPANATLAGANNPATLTITDDDTAGVTLTESEGSTDVAEGGADDSYTIVLDSEPTDDVIITVTPDDQSDVSNGPGVSFDLTFTSANWNEPQTVTVTANDDDIDEDAHLSTITHSAASTDRDYDGMAIRDVTANISDDDTAGVTISETDDSTEVSENGTSDTYTIVLDSEPTADVIITIDPDEQSDVGNGSDEPLELVFTSSDWNTPQTLTISAKNDWNYEGFHVSTITHTAASDDPLYDGITIPDLSVGITDYRGGGGGGGDGGAGSDEDNSLTIINILITLNVSTDEVLVGEEVEFSAIIEDASDDLPTVLFTWDFDFIDGIQEDASGAEATHIYDKAGLYHVTLIVREDESGTTASEVIVITVREADTGGSDFRSFPPAPAALDSEVNSCDLCGLRCGFFCSLELTFLLLGLVGLRISWPSDRSGGLS